MKCGCNGNCTCGRGGKRVTLADVAGSLGAARGTDCIWCNGPTRRTGSCFTCVACGTTTSCG